MMVYVDTSVFMHATGRDHPLRQPCTEVLRRVVAGRVKGATSAESVQEILHRFAQSDRRDQGLGMARAVLDLFDPVLPVDATTMGVAIELHSAYPRLSSRDAVHVATCMVHRIPTIVSSDSDFDDVQEIERIDPAALAAG